jgi:hypothetical protein
VLGGSEGQKTQVIAAMRFLGLVRDNGDVTDQMSRLIEASDKERQQVVKELLVKHYPKATELAAINATTKQLEETFTGIGGDTLRKAVAFYLHAARYSGHHVSKHFKVPSFIARPGAPRRRRSAISNGDDETDGTETATPQPTDPKTRYLEMLMERAASSEELDTTLLDRIEKLLGYSPSEGPDNG